MPNKFLDLNECKRELLAADTIALVAAISLTLATALSFAASLKLSHSGSGLFLESVASGSLRNWLQPVLWSVALVAFAIRRPRIAAFFAGIAAVIMLIDFVSGWSWNAPMGTASAVLAVDLCAVLASVKCTRSALSKFPVRLYITISLFAVLLFAASGLSSSRSIDVHAWWHKWLPDFNTVWLWHKTLFPLTALLLVRKRPRFLLAAGFVLLVQFGGECVYSLVHYVKISLSSYGHPSSAWQLIVSQVVVVGNYLTLPAVLLGLGVVATLRTDQRGE